MSVLKIRDAAGNWQEITAIKGEDYVLTDADKQEIAELAGGGFDGGDIETEGKLYLAKIGTSVNDNSASRLVFGTPSSPKSFVASNTSGAIAFGRSGSQDNITFYPNVGNYNCIMSTCNSDLGRTDKPWKDLYLSGKITDGTNAITVAELAKLGEVERVDIYCDATAEASGTDINTALGLQYIHNKIKDGKLPNLSNYYINGSAIIEGNVVTINGKTAIKLYVIDAPGIMKCFTYPIISVEGSVNYNAYNVENTGLTGGGSGEGGDISSYTLTLDFKQTAADKAFLEDYLAYYKANKVPKTVDIYFNDTDFQMFRLATNFRVSSDYQMLSLFFFEPEGKVWWGMTYGFNADGSYKDASQYINYLPENSSGGEGWNIAYEGWDNNLYNANEVFVMCSTGCSAKSYSYVAFQPETTLGGYHTNEEFPLMLTYDTKTNENLPYWYYDGTWLNLNNADGWNIDYILYK